MSTAYPLAIELKSIYVFSFFIKKLSPDLILFKPTYCNKLLTSDFFGLLVNFSGPKPHRLTIGPIVGSKYPSVNL